MERVMASIWGVRTEVSLGSWAEIKALGFEKRQRNFGKLNDGTEFLDVLKEVAAAREAKKASLRGLERMQYNLYMRLWGWILSETGYRCVSVGEVVDKVKKYAPKAILKSRVCFERAVRDLWSGAHGYDLDSDADLREDLEWELSYIY